jgi:hypothetical protein
VSRLKESPAGFTVVLAALAASCAEPGGGSASSTRQAAEPSAPEVLVSRVYWRDLADRDRLAVELDALEVASQVEGWIGALLSPSEHEALAARGYRVEIDAAATHRVNEPRAPLEGQISGIPGFPCYRTVEEAAATGEAIAASHPQLARWLDIGDSHDKATPGGSPGYDLNVLVLGNQSAPGPKPRFFLMGAIHAREYTTAETTTRFAEWLVDQYGVDADATWLLDHFELHVLFHSNPDGRKVAEQGYLQRKNTDRSNGNCSDPPTGSNQYGVDLNRNSTFLWGGSGSSTAPCSQTYRGPAAGSAAEVDAVEDYLRAIFPDQRGPGMNDPAPADTTGVMITLHSYAQLVLYPWGATSASAPNLAALRTLGRKFGYWNGYEVCQAPLCLYSATGTTDDFAYGDLGIAAYTFEIGTDFFQSCEAFESEVYPQNAPALLYAFKAARRPYLNAGGPDVYGLAFNPPSAIAGQTVQLTGVADDTRSSSNGHGDEPVHAIAEARYSLGAPSWAPGAALQPLGAADGSFNAGAELISGAVSTAGLPVGRYLFYVEARDASGAWGVPTGVFLDVRPREIGVAVTPGTSSRDGVTGAAPVTYALTVRNTGNLPDTFDVALSGANWPTSAPASVGPIAAGGTATLTVAVAVPQDAEPFSTDVAQVTLSSRADPGRTAAAQLTTRAISDDTVAPVVAVRRPLPGSVVSGAAQIDVVATDDRQVRRVEISAGGVVVATLTAPPYTVSWDTTQAADGPQVVYARAFDRAGNSATTSPVEVTVANGSRCTRVDQLVANGDFEAGEEGWTVAGADVVDQRTDTPARSGKREASLGGYGVAGVEEIGQAVAIDPGACSAALRLWVRVITAEPAGAAADRLEVIAIDEAGAPKALASLSNLDATGGYEPVEINLAGLRGKSLQLWFRATENGANATTFLVDDVTLHVTSAQAVPSGRPAAASAPAARPGTISTSAPSAGATRPIR